MDYPEYRTWEPAKAVLQGYPITKYQPVLFVANSLVRHPPSLFLYYAELLPSNAHVEPTHLAPVSPDLFYIAARRESANATLLRQPLSAVSSRTSLL